MPTLFTCIAHIFVLHLTCTALICLLYKDTHVYSFIVKYNLQSLSISNMLNDVGLELQQVFFAPTAPLECLFKFCQLDLLDLLSSQG